jgi:hypothetical protein
MAFVIGGVAGVLGLVFHWPVSYVLGCMALPVDAPEDWEGDL